jgi:hypothetical protein
LDTLGWNIQKLKMVSTVHRVDSLAHMFIVFDSKSSLTHYTFDKIKFLGQLHICIILLYLIFYFSKFMFKSWLVAHENWVSVGSFLVPGNCKNAGFFTIYPRVYGVLSGPQKPCRKVTSARWGRVTSWPSTRLLNRFEYTSFWGSYAPDSDKNVSKERLKIPDRYSEAF